MSIAASSPSSPKTTHTLDYTHYWSRTSLEPVARLNVSELYPFALSVILNGDVHCFSSLSELPPDAPDRDALGRTGTQSAAVVPLMAAGRVIGSLGFTSARERSWDPAIVNRLRLVADVLSSALARKRADAELRAMVDGRIAFETLIADLSSHFVNLDSNLMDSVIEDAQRRIAEALDVDRSTLFQVSEPADNSDYSLLVASGRASFGSLDSHHQRFPWAAARVMKGEVVCFGSVDELPAEASLDRQGYEAIGTKSNVTIPLVVSGRTVGAMTFVR